MNWDLARPAATLAGTPSSGTVVLQAVADQDEFTAAYRRTQCSSLAAQDGEYKQNGNHNPQVKITSSTLNDGVLIEPITDVVEVGDCATTRLLLPAC